MYHPKEFYQLQFEFESFQKLIEEEAGAFQTRALNSLKWNLIFNSPIFTGSQELTNSQMTINAQNVYELLADYEGFKLLKLFILQILNK